LKGIPQEETHDAPITPQILGRLLLEKKRGQAGLLNQPDPFSALPFFRSFPLAGDGIPCGPRSQAAIAKDNKFMPAKTKHTYDWPRPALTADVILVSRDLQPRVLLIRRQAEPFAGLWALPGGFVDAGESLADAAKREMREETGLDVQDLEQLYTAGEPGRDPRGWTVSVCYLARVDAVAVTPRAGDDAAAVKWFPINRLPRLAFDHAMLIARAKSRINDRAV
jgi:8-oxo-dGTP diphosphatase